MANTRTAKPANRGTSDYLNELNSRINYGGYMLPRHEVCRLMQAEGRPADYINRWMQEYDASAKQREETDDAPIIGSSDGRHFYCFDCSDPTNPPVHGDSDPECVPPTCHRCKKTLTAK